MSGTKFCPHVLWESTLRPLSDALRLLYEGRGVLWLSHCHRRSPRRMLEQFRSENQDAREADNPALMTFRIMSPIQRLTPIDVIKCAGRVTSLDLLCPISDWSALSVTCCSSIFCESRSVSTSSKALATESSSRIVCSRNSEDMIDWRTLFADPDTVERARSVFVKS